MPVFQYVRILCFRTTLGLARGLEGLRTALALLALALTAGIKQPRRRTRCLPGKVGPASGHHHREAEGGRKAVLGWNTDFFRKVGLRLTSRPSSMVFQNPLTPLAGIGGFRGHVSCTAKTALRPPRARQGRGTTEAGCSERGPWRLREPLPQPARGVCCLLFLVYITWPSFD